MNTSLHFYFVLELFPREIVVKNTLLALVLVCFGFVGLSRLSCPNLFLLVYKNFFSSKTYDSTLNDSEKISPFANAMLVLNLMISMNICLVSILDTNIDAESFMQITFFVTTGYLFFGLISYRIASLLFGDKSFGKSLGLFTQQTYNFTGLLLLVLALLVLLNTAYKEGIQYLVFAALLSLPISKGIKGIFYAKANKFRWLYIILYLCTLEILPLIVLGYYFVGKI